MKAVVALATVFAAALAIPADYSSEFDNLNTDEIVANVRLLKSYINCLLDKGPCTSEGKYIKAQIPDALSTECSKCSSKQRPLIRKMIRAFQEKLPELWEELAQKHDPTRKYTESFEKFLNASD